jgi:hypothetical protein
MPYIHSVWRGQATQAGEGGRLRQRRPVRVADSGQRRHGQPLRAGADVGRPADSASWGRGGRAGWASEVARGQMGAEAAVAWRAVAVRRVAAVASFQFFCDVLIDTTGA